MAAVLLDGSAEIAAEGGVACALNFQLVDSKMVTDTAAGSVSAGLGSVVVAFTEDKSGGRVPVVGFIGPRPRGLGKNSKLASQLLSFGVQFGLKPNTVYRLNPQTRQFKETPNPKVKAPIGVR